MLFSKPDAAKLLETALRKPGYQCQPIALGVNTDAYQPIERQKEISRSVLAVLQAFNHPVSIITKSALIKRDLDILKGMAELDLISVCISITTFDKSIARSLEPRAAAPHRRIQTIRTLSEAGIPVTVLVAPVIPVLTDPELDSIIQSAAEAGATAADYILLRLPAEVAGLFEEWLQVHFPLKANHVMTRIRDTRDGKIYDNRFGKRMKGTGEYANIISQRFALACRKHGLKRREPTLRSELFKAPARSGDQIDLF
ncbi:MAG: DNA repair photolyase [Gammaproteobacteria bacterium]|jgi:DNA repair photolyase